ncbi:helix-turn-helix domain-containing protein [Sphingobium sp.]|uniref:TetR/AcrR family transcriptional regulator n=1 Tax=Sphingobium sp. TaxID=1912891 RepID=UPI002BF6D1ED|nr:helix-turn-helix domain-containing protein [Sphingobium sp.]HUD94933.1 helix-turn-helix domain-containing protein [Sphingobium sp.]
MRKAELAAVPRKALNERLFPKEFANPPMPAVRLSSADRRNSIISAAKAVFARYGLEGARTQQIAQAAGVSEALIFRHFATKTHIYRAVLREVIAEQNATFSAMDTVEASADGALEIIRRLVDHAMKGAEADNVAGMRMVVGSLAGDGGYARLIYRRALRLSLPALDSALAAARAEGAITGAAIATVNAVAFLEHVGTMMLMAHCHSRTAIPYDDDDRRVKRDAILFCARGLGIAENRIQTFLDRFYA